METVFLLGLLLGVQFPNVFSLHCILSKLMINLHPTVSVIRLADRSVCAYSNVLASLYYC